MSQKIFVVEDDALTVAQLQQYILQMGYEFAGDADNAKSALEQIAQTQPDLVLMDIRLKGDMDGIEVAAALLADKGVPVIYLTAYADDETVARAKPTEPMGYLVKPFSRQELNASIQMGLYKSLMERKQQRILEGVVHAITGLVKMHDAFLNDLQIHAGTLAQALATELHLPGQEVKGIRMAALLHAVGLVALPADVLCYLTPRNHPLSVAIQSHPHTAYELLKDIEFEFPVAEMVYQHRERLDGSGFPRGLTGDAILPGARVVAVACQAAKRLTPFGGREAASIDETLSELEQGRGTLFDAPAVDACVRLFREKGFRFTPEAS